MEEKTTFDIQDDNFSVSAESTLSFLSGITFKTDDDGKRRVDNSDFNDELLFDSLSDSDEELPKEPGCPGGKSFAELSAKMKLVSDDGNIKKKILSPGHGEKISGDVDVVINYNGFWEGDIVPFDSTFMKNEPKVFRTNGGEILLGLEEAVKTMIVGEESQFMISYNLLFGEYGCPPRVGPKADGLFTIHLLRIGNSLLAPEIYEQLDREDKLKFINSYKPAKTLHLTGVKHYQKNNIKEAVKCFCRSVRILETSRLANEEEQTKQQRLLLKLYTNMSICYNKLKLPRKACCMCNEVNRITNFKMPSKVLFQNGRALLMMGEYKEAKVKLSKVAKMEPNNQEVKNELKLLGIKVAEKQKADNLLGPCLR